MRFYGVIRTHGFDGTRDKLYVFDNKADRDRFLKTGELYAYQLIVPWETFPVKASEAKQYANTDSFGDKYACLYFGGVEYVWGQANYIRWCKQYDERRTACQRTS